MAHLIDTMAYTGQTPWHELGNALPPKQPIKVWAKEAGMNWRICESPVHYQTDDTNEETVLTDINSIQTFPDQKVLYRSDNHLPLSVVSKRYQVVQPQEVLEFYRDLTEYSGFELETAGVLKQGRKFWALARTGKKAVLKGNDQVNGYLLLATSCDGTLATIATPTTVRVVCNNTLAVAINGAEQAIKVPHRSSFDADAVKKRLGVAVSHWDEFMYRMKILSERPVKNHEAMTYFHKVLCQNNDSAIRLYQNPGQISAGSLNNERALKKVQALYEGHGRGAELQAAKGTAWGLLSAITEFVDHEKQARSQENRLDSAWFGSGALLKQRALDSALELVA